MKSPINDISYHEIIRLFDYYEDGYLVWKINRGKCKVGDIAGCKDGLYWTVKINYRKYPLHRLIFLWHNKYLPENLVDHIDQNPSNNRIENLREVSHQCNMRNCRLSKNNSSGISGVSFISKSKKWQSTITINGKNVNLGLYKKFDDAVMIRWKKERELNWNGCNSTSSAYLYLKENKLLPKLKIRRIVH